MVPGVRVGGVSRPVRFQFLINTEIAFETIHDLRNAPVQGRPHHLVFRHGPEHSLHDEIGILISGGTALLN